MSGGLTILKMGPITPLIEIVIAGIVIIAIATSYHHKGSFAIAVVFCSVVWWIHTSKQNTYILVIKRSLLS